MKLDELKQICDEATKGPWFNGGWSGQCHLAHYPHGRLATTPCKYDYTKNQNARYVSSAAIPNRELVTCDDWGPVLSKADAAFIVAARNYMPILIEIARLAKNMPWCVDPYIGPPKRRCGECDMCQLSNALAALDAEKPADL